MAQSNNIPTPPTLNAYTTFPFNVDVLDQDWMRQWCAFEPIAASDANFEVPDHNHYET
jgi:hypothetical protein